MSKKWGKTKPIKAAAQRDEPRAFRATGTVRIAAEAGAEGKLASFEGVAYTGAPMKPEGWWLPVIIDLDGVKIPSQHRPALRQHDHEQIVGHTTEVKASKDGITVAGVFSGEPQHVQKVTIPAKGGFQWQLSVGANPVRTEFLEAGETTNVNGRDVTGPMTIARETEIGEISFVPLGADDDTSVTVAASKGRNMNPFALSLKALMADIRAGKTRVKAAKYSDEDIDKMSVDDARAAVRECMKAEEDKEEEETKAAKKTKAKAADDDPPADDKKKDDDKAEAARIQRIQAKATADEMGRQQAIIAAVGKHGFTASSPAIEIEHGGAKITANLVQHAIAESLTLDQAELIAVRAARPGPGVGLIVRGHERDCTMQALQGAMILRAGSSRGIGLDNPVYQTQQALAMNLPAWLRAGLNTDQRQRAMEAAWRYRDMSMVDIAAQACRIDGIDPGHSRDEMIRASFSGGTLSSIFTTNINTILLATYMQTADTSAGWTREAEVNDFKSNERPRMTKASGLAKLPRGGEADHLTRSDTGESYKIARYAKQVVVDEQDFIDDHFNALADMPFEMGQAAARLRPDLVYALLLANPTLSYTALAVFSASNVGGSNLNISAALSSVNMQTAIANMALVQENSVNLGLKATHILTPPLLGFTARNLLQSSTIVIAGTAGSVTTNGTKNTLEGLVQPVEEARLQNGVTDPSSGTTYSGSATTWYLASTEAHGIEVGYRRGTGKAPQVRPFILTQGKWGLGWDVNLDIGAKALDWRGLQKNTA